MSLSFSSLSLLGGLLMGLASSVHCIGMCGGIASVLVLSLDGESKSDGDSKGDGDTKGNGDSTNGGATSGAMTRRHRARTLLLLQGGRVASYTAMGIIAGGFGAAALRGLDHTAAFGLMRTLAALSLGWVGLTLTGLAPGVRLLDRLFLAIGGAVQRLRRMAPRCPGAGAALAGLAWGFVPCGMVYGGLVLAMASGSAAGGARIMVGFGLGTVPAITAVALGATSLRRMARRPGMQTLIGCAVIALAAGSTLVPAAMVRSLCLAG